MHGAMKPFGNTQARGSALIVALALVALLASISSVLMSEMMTRAKHVEVDLEDIKAFEAAEAGIDAALNDINSAPVYQPYMSGPAIVVNGISQPPADATRQSNGMLDSSGVLISGNTTGVPLVGQDSGKPITVHVTRKQDGTKPGCIGTSSWVAANDIDGNGRPTWKSRPMTDSNGVNLTFGSGNLRYCEDNIQPQALGNVAFFTYAIDWFHDGINNNPGNPPVGDAVNDDRSERNKYTIYSTGIHRGISQSGVTETGKVVTIEVTVEAMDRDYLQVPAGALEIPIKSRLP